MRVFSQWRAKLPELCALLPAARMNLWTHALHFLNEALMNDEAPAGLSEKRKWAMDACVKAAMWQQAVALLSDMKMAQLEP
eukprot:5494935-Amphidinium_carterae.1